MEFVLQQLRMPSSPSVASTTTLNPATLDANGVEASCIVPTSTTNNKELSIKEDQEG